MFFRNLVEDTLGQMSNSVDRQAGLALFQATKPNAPVLLAFCKTHYDPNDVAKFVREYQPVIASLHVSVEAVDIKMEGRKTSQKTIYVVLKKVMMTVHELNAVIYLGNTIAIREGSYISDRQSSPTI